MWSHPTTLFLVPIPCQMHVPNLPALCYFRAVSWSMTNSQVFYLYRSSLPMYAPDFSGFIDWSWVCHALPFVPGGPAFPGSPWAPISPTRKNSVYMCILQSDQRRGDTEAWAARPQLLQKQGRCFLFIGWYFTTYLTPFLLLQLYYTGTANVSLILQFTYEFLWALYILEPVCGFCPSGAASSAVVTHFAYKSTMTWEALKDSYGYEVTFNSSSPPQQSNLISKHSLLGFGISPFVPGRPGSPFEPEAPGIPGHPWRTASRSASPSPTILTSELMKTVIMEIIMTLKCLGEETEPFGLQKQSKRQR